MWMLIVAWLLQQNIPGVLSGPDPAQMEKAPDLGYKPVPHGLQIPSSITMGAPSGVGITSDGHLIVFRQVRQVRCPGFSSGKRDDTGCGDG